jgi:hypothetical protein
VPFVARNVPTVFRAAYLAAEAVRRVSAPWFCFEKKAQSPQKGICRER